jgi:multidrug efflux pump subunit AcrA (membrane-fusion protein)
MMFKSRRTKLVLVPVSVATLLAILVCTACGAIGGRGAPTPTSDVGEGIPTALPSPPATPQSTPASASGLRSATVQRDSITEVLQLDGTITATDTLPVTYNGTGKVLDVKVKTGESVTQGEVLLDLDGTDVSRALDAAQTRYQTSQASLAQARLQVTAQQQTSAQQAATAAAQQQQTIADDQTALRKAQDNLAAVMAGASAAEKHAAENNLAAAQSALSKTKSAQDSLTAGPDPAAVRAAQADINTAQLAADKAKGDLDTLIKGADPITLSTAQRDLARAQSNLTVAQGAKIDPKAPDPTAARAAHDNAIADAQLAVQVAQDKLTKLQQPPSDVDVQAARQKVRDTQNAVTAAQGKLSGLTQPADQSALDAAQAAVDSAQNGVSDAQANLNAVNSRPTPRDAADAQDQVRRAQAALDAARAGPSVPQVAASNVDLGALQDAVNQDGANVDNLKQQLDAMRVTAPIDGIITSVRAKPGDSITSAKPVFVVAQPSAPVVRAQLDANQASRLQVGQSATIDLGDGSSAITASVASVTPPSAGGGDPSADLIVDWPASGAPKLGLPVQANVTIQTKQDVLVVPAKAVRTSAGKASVEVLDGSLRKLTAVQIGVTTANKIEIVSGLTEGQVVQVNP